MLKVHARALRDGLMVLEIKATLHTANTPLTEGCTERKAAVYTDEDICVYNYTAADNPEALILGLSRKYESVVQWDSGNTYGDGVRYGAQTTKPVVANEMATNAVDKQMWCKTAES